MQAVVFQGTAGLRYLLVSTLIGELWGYDGATWTQAGTFAVGKYAERVERLGHELYIGSGWEVFVCTADPMLAASWGGSIQVGDKATRISNLRAVGDVLYIWKWDGVYTLTVTGTGVLDNDILPELRASPQVLNGRDVAVWRDAAYAGYGDGLYALSSGGDLTPVGLETLIENDGPVRGRPVASAPFGDWFLLHAVHDATAGVSYLCKLGTWTPGEDGGTWAARWHGAIAHWSKQVTRLDVIAFNTDLDPTLDGPTLWVGFSDGTVQQTPLPRRTPDPALDTRCRFVATGRLFWPRQTGGYPVTVKSWAGFSVLGSLLPTGTAMQQAYRLTPTGAFTDIGTVFTPALAAAAHRVELPDDATSVMLDAYTDLVTTDATVTPVMEGIGLHYAARPTLRLEYRAIVRGANHLVRHDGVVSRRSATRIRALVKTAAQQPGKVRIRLPDAVEGSVAFIEYTEALAPAEGRSGLAWELPILFVAFR